MVFADAKYIEADLVGERDRLEQLAEMFCGVDCPARRVNGCGYKTIYADLHCSKGALSRKIHSGPRCELGRLTACYFVCERNSVERILTQVGMSLPVTEHRCHLGATREKRGENFL